MIDGAQTHATPLHLYVGTQRDCARRVVALKLRTSDCATTELTGPGLLHALQMLITEQGIMEQVEVRETSCMRGCRVGPRLNVVGEGGFTDAVRYLHLPAHRGNWRCVAWAEIDCVEALLDQFKENRLLSDI